MKQPSVELPDSTGASRRSFLQTSLLAGVSTAALPALAGAREVAPSPPSQLAPKPSELDEATIADLQAGMASGKCSARSVTEMYLSRIEQIDDCRQRSPQRDPAVADDLERRGVLSIS